MKLTNYIEECAKKCRIKKYLITYSHINVSGYFSLKEDGYGWVLGEVYMKIHSKNLEE